MTKFVMVGIPKSLINEDRIAITVKCYCYDCGKPDLYVSKAAIALMNKHENSLILCMECEKKVNNAKYVDMQDLYDASTSTGEDIEDFEINENKQSSIKLQLEKMNFFEKVFNLYGQL